MGNVDGKALAEVASKQGVNTRRKRANRRGMHLDRSMKKRASNTWRRPSAAARE
jgi:hypothetical protein